ncbi:Aldo/keto reductase [Sistotremastrum niveocremeum HHB9708]|uniref:Aldo/keto reductase n=1 Tax=Sistotremastrum niveocremeum HHB9708 TaxID=1314777 RepID=A0A164YWV6_9AGAM|nr:Aldo/keto reductase [Sistotremastrum niveocremeum HHB9708]
MAIPPRKIGDATFPAIGFGAMGLSGFYGATESDEDRFKVLDQCLAAGSTHWDTADMYLDNEDFIGKWFKRTGKRDQIFLATKFGFTGQGIRGDSPYVRQAFEKSVKRLGVDVIDLYYAHRVDKNTPIEETVEAMAQLVKEGKVRYLGLSEPSVSSLRRAHAVHPIAAIQVEYSPFVLDIEKMGLLDAARELGVKIVAYSPLARGLVTGQYKSPEDFEKDDFRRVVPKYSAENFPKLLKVVDDLKKIGEKYDATAGQVTLSWLLQQGDDIIPIPGTKKIKYLNENLGAYKVHLTPDEVKEIRVLAEDADAVEGDRYPPGFQEMLFADTPERK